MADPRKAQEIVNALSREGRWDSIVGPRDFRELGTGGADIPDGRCKNCGNFGPVRNGSEGYGHPVLLLHMTKMSHFRESCKYCRLLRSIVLAFAPDGVGLGDGINLEIPEDRPALLNFRGKEEVASDQRRILRSVVIYTDKRCRDIPTLGSLSNMPRHSGSVNSFTFIRKQLAQCMLSHHVLCRSPAAAPMPKRVLSVGEGSDEPPWISLIEGDGATEGYAALSHRWGGHEPIRTTSLNITRMKHKIPWTELSRVFQDAVMVCRGLGIRYLWIDSLCIIQDSDEDWDTESAKMCDYYGNALITISAGSSPDGTVPFLAERNARWLPRSFKFINDDGSSSTIFAKETPRHLDEQDVEPITTRGWAWQEAIMSTRIVHYTASGILWICGKETVAEDGGSGHSWFHCGYLKARLPNLDPGHLRKISKGDPAELHHMAQFLWLDLVKTYTSKALTYEADRLPALSGVAAKFHRATGAPYMAGLWATNGFVRSLCWKNDTFNSSRTWRPAPSEYLAPSWSWVSLSDQVKWITLTAYTFVPFAERMYASCEVAGANPFGRVSSGYMILRGPVIKVRLESGDANDPQSYRLFRIRRWFRDKKGLHMNPDSPVACVDGRPERARQGRRYTPYNGEVFCLLLGQSFPFYKGEPTVTFALVLGWGAEEATFHRLGVVEMHTSSRRIPRFFRKAAVMNMLIL